MKNQRLDLKNRNLPLAENHSEVEIALIKGALGEIDPSSTEAAEFFNVGLPNGHKARVSRQTVWYWVSGGYRVQESRLRTWKAFSADDPRHKLATDIFALREREAAEFAAHWVGSSTTLDKQRKKIKAAAGGERSLGMKPA